MTSDVSSDYFKTVEDSTLLLHYPVSTGVGESGTPLPYTLRGDNVITVSLLLCFIVYVLSLAHSGRYIIRLLKDFFRFTYVESSDAYSPHLAFYLSMAFVNCLMLAICSYEYATDGLGFDFVIESQALVIAIFLGLFVLYFFLKWLAYRIVNEVFFGSNKSLQWTRSFLFIMALEGVLLFPLVLITVYFAFSAPKALFYFCCVLFLTKILTFYKSWSIFFRQKGLFLQIFLYFCALEVTPLLAFCGVLLAIVNLLKVNF